MLGTLLHHIYVWSKESNDSLSGAVATEDEEDLSA